MLQVVSDELANAGLRGIFICGVDNQVIFPIKTRENWSWGTGETELLSCRGATVVLESGTLFADRVQIGKIGFGLSTWHICIETVVSWCLATKTRQEKPNFQRIKRWARRDLSDF